MNYIDPLSLKSNPVTGRKFSDEYYNINNLLINDYKLPVLTRTIYNEFKTKLDNSDVLIIESTTGSGKSIGSAPIIQRIYNYKVKILISQPRTVNIESTAEMIAKQLDLKIGEEIGYQYSDGHMENPQKSLVHVVTDFFLIKLMSTTKKQIDVEGIRRSEVDYDIFIIDEVHERGINMDIFMTAMKIYYMDTPKTEKRKKLILLSATLDVSKFISYYEQYATVSHINITKKAYPIYNMYVKYDITDKDLAKYEEVITETVKALLMNTFIRTYERWKKTICKTCTKDCRDDKGRFIPCEVNTSGIKNSKIGDILVFIPITPMVNRMKRTFEIWSKGYEVIKWKKSGDKEIPIKKKDIKGKKYAGTVLFSSLSRHTPTKEREYITMKPEDTYLKDGFTRRVIFSTPIAETGITLTGIKFVVDTGVENKIAFDPKRRRRLQYISYVRKPSVVQRCGRTGRREPGVCIHLYTLDTYLNRFKTKIIPKIYADDIHLVFLTILYHTLDVKKAIDYMNNLPDPIDTTLLSQTIYDLYSSGVILSNSLSLMGIAMVNLGLDFKLAMVLVKAFQYTNREEEINVIARHIIPIIAILKIDPNLDKWISTDKKRFRNKYGDIIAMLKIYSYYYKYFVIKNEKVIWRSLKSQKKGKLFEKKLEVWSEKHGFNFYNIRRLLPEIFKLTKKIKRGAKYFDKFKALKSNVKKSISRDDIYTIITSIFANVYAENRAIYVPKVNAYVLDDNEPLGKLKSEFIEFKHKPSMIGFIDLIYLERSFPKKGMRPKLIAPFVIVSKLMID
jgi:HrpA-like RNA helicase